MQTKHQSISNPPGGLLIWIVIFLELITFGLALVALVYYGRLNPIEFQESRAVLNTNYGAINTIFLLLSGYFMALSVKQFQLKSINISKQYLLLTMVFGLFFLALKAVEYSSKINQGYDLDYNTFFNFYWLLTGFHVIHVIVGLIILAYFYMQLCINKNNVMTEDYEAGAAFWHMCDLIWLLLFPIVYLIF